MKVATRKKRNYGKYIVIAFLILFTIYTMIPIYYIVVSSFKMQIESIRSPLGFPNPIRYENYVNAFNEMRYFRALRNNATITISAVTGIVVLSSMAAYPLARLKIKLNRFIFVGFLCGMMIPGQMLLFPLFRLMAGFGLINNLFSVILLQVTGGLPFAVFLFTGFIKTIPYEIEEAAYIDGAGPFKTFWKVLLPLIKPVVATVVILNSLSSWNDFLGPLMFLQSRDRGVLLLEVFRNIGRWGTNFFAMLPMLVLTVLPIMVLYLFLQRYIIKGVISGSLKG